MANDLFCEPCDEDGQHLTAEGYCLDCQDYLCRMCLDYHRRPKPMRHHVLLEHSQMPRSKPPGRPKDIFVDYCALHPSKLLEFYCGSDDSLVCSLCMLNEHRKCEDIHHIPDIAEGIENSQEYKNLYKGLNDCVHVIDINKDKTEENLTEATTYTDTALSHINAFRKEINEFFDRLDKDMHNEVKVNMEGVERNMKSISENCQTLKSDIQHMLTNLDNREKSKQNCQLFIAMKKSEKELQIFEDKLKQLCAGNRITSYQFETDGRITDLIRDVQSLGQLVATNAPTDEKVVKSEVINMKMTSPEPKYANRSFSRGANSTLSSFNLKSPKKLTETVSSKSPLLTSPPKITKDFTSKSPLTETKSSTLTQDGISALPSVGMKSTTSVTKDLSSISPSVELKSPSLKLKHPSNITKDGKVALSTNINTKAKNDQRVCYITGSVMLADGHLVVVDHWNNCVKLLNVKQPTVVSKLTTSYGPWDITKISEDRVAVTLPVGNQIQFLSVVGTLSKQQHIGVNGCCRGIVYSNDSLIVSFTSKSASDPANIQIISMAGVVLRVFQSDNKGDKLFISPMHLAISPDHSTIYVSDMDANAVISLSRDGHVMATYQNSDLFEPSGMTVDTYGHVYVCGLGSVTIHQISADCNRVHGVLGSRDGLWLPESVTYCHRESRLYVGMYEKDVIKVFQMKVLE